MSALRAVSEGEADWRPMPVRVSGGVPATDGQLVYAIGDIHGCYDLLRRALALVAEDAAQQSGTRRPLLILAGDYVDRGPDSAEVIDAILWLQRQGRVELHALRGNHEQAMLDFIADPAGRAEWLRWGGTETLRSYGVDPDDAAADPAALRDALLARMPAAHLHLLAELPLAVTVGDYAFAHAGVRPGTALEEQAAEDLLWIRGSFLDSADDHGRIVVHGHSWSGDRPDFAANRIGIDTGAYETGVLTVLRLDGASAAYAQVGR